MLNNYRREIIVVKYFMSFIYPTTLSFKCILAYIHLVVNENKVIHLYLQSCEIFIILFMYGVVYRFALHHILMIHRFFLQNKFMVQKSYRINKKKKIGETFKMCLNFSFLVELLTCFKFSSFLLTFEFSLSKPKINNHSC